MLPIILTVGGGLLLALGVRFATRGDSFRVERSARIDAPPERIYPLLIDFREWRRWSPWEEVDPALVRKYEGPEQGVGSVYSWSGNRKAGEGRMEMLRTEPGRSLAIQIDFLQPFQSRNIIDFTLTPRDAGTELNWAMHGPNSTASRLLQTVVSMDKMVGADFEKGLARLKAAAEAGA